MNILYISQYFPPEMGAPAARVYELSREWVRMGHHVTVLTGFPNHPTGEIPPEYRGEWFRREEKDGIEIIRTWLYAAPNKGTIKRILNYLSFSLSAVCLGSPFVHQCDVVIATSPQFFVGVSGWFIAECLLKRPFVFEVRDLWPDSIEAVGAITNRAVIRVLRSIEEFLYRRASRIVAVARSTIGILSKRGFDTRKIYLVPNGVDLDLFEPGPIENSVRKQYARPGEFVVSYIGTHGIAHALHTVLDAARELQSKGRFRFLFVGEGAEKQALMRYAEQYRLTNVTFLPQQPREMLPEFYRASDVCLVPLRRVPLFRAVLPSKIFEIMGTARPIILSVEGEASELIQEAQAGMIVEPESVEPLVEALIKLADDPALGNWYGQNGRRYVEHFYNRSYLANRYAQMLESLVHNTKKSCHRERT